MKPNELKKEALSNFSGKFLKLLSMQFIYLLIVFAISLLTGFLVSKTSASSSMSSLFLLIYYIISFPLSFGILSVTMRMSKKEDVSSTEFINVSLKKFISYWKVMLRIFIKILLPIILFFIIAVFVTTFVLTHTSTITELSNTTFILSYLVSLITIVFIIYLVLPYALSLFILHDNPDKSSKEILEISSNMMKNNKFNYIKLLLSFIGWYLLFGIIAYISKEFLPQIVSMFVDYIPTLLLVPYITITQLAFYENVKTNINSNDNATLETEE